MQWKHGKILAGVADALSQSIPSVLGTGSAAQQDGPVSSARSPSRRAKVSESQDDEPRSAVSNISP